jgi:hypothetical protein
MTDTIERGGRRFVLVPEKTYARMVEDLDMLADIKAYDRAKAKPQEFVPPPWSTASSPVRTGSKRGASTAA